VTVDRHDGRTRGERDAESQGAEAWISHRLSP